MKSPPPLILASTSRYRKELLERLALTFTCVAPGVDEAPLPGESAKALVARLASAKATAVASQYPEAWVIGCDQVAVRVDEAKKEWVLGKPKTAAHCEEQLQACSGRILSFLTAVAVMHEESGALIEFIDTTRVLFRALDPAAIKRYVAKEQPLDCAGGFKSEGLGITLCESIDSSDPSALIGLPLMRLGAVLRDAGYELP
ncbi:MAG TPA: nucleoside triphosphate pyrophosphatase [Steroidobacteraceae bacterium]